MILSNQAVKLSKTNMSTAENSGCSLLRRYACYMRPSGKLAECWDANTGLRASCPNLQPKNDGPKVRHDFQFLAYCVEYTSFFKQKMHDRFRLLDLKLPLQKRLEAKEILLVPTDAAQNPIIGPDLSEPSAYLPHSQKEIVNCVNVRRFLR